MQVTEYNVGRWCLSEDECIAQGIDFAAYERGVSDAAKAFGQNASSPVAPVGAPRLLSDEELHALACQAILDVPWDEQIQRKFCEVNGIRQGCELATDATKQQREKADSSHLAATPIDQDFRRRPASSEAAPTAEGSGLDAARFAWYFSDKPKGEFLMTYLAGMRTGWTTDEWRSAIDAAMEEQP